jgi:2-isopropylmalate synthase
MVSGINITPQSAISMRRKDAIIKDAAVGNGPVDAVFKCIDRITGVRAKLVRYDLKAVTSGKDALGEALVQVEVAGELITGQASSTDVIEASARAYIKAINKAVTAS